MGTSADRLISMETLTPETIEQRMSELVEACRQDHLGEPETGADGIPTPIQALNAVWDEASRAGRGGKRLRALLLWDTYRAIGAGEENTDQAVIDLACALEVYQTSALVHDDIIDNSPLRRGKPSSHMVLSNLTGPEENPERTDLGNPMRQDHLGAGRSSEATAARGRGLGILLGDLLSTSSSDLVSRASASLPSGESILRAFLGMQTAVETGQVLDMGMEIMPLDDPEQLRREAFRTMGWKTASYTTMAPLALGLMAGGIDPDRTRALAYDLGLHLGLLFQLRDDLLDVEGRSGQTGKPQGGDILEGKRTVLLADTLSMASPDEAERLRAAYRAPQRTPDQVAWVRRLMETSGAVEKSRNRMDRLTSSVHEEIANLCRELSLDDRQGSIIERACRRFMPDAATPGYHRHGIDG